MIKKVTIYGERCSGTNYLEKLLKINFDIEIVWCHGWKHFYGFSDLSNSDDVLFIGIIRNITDWTNSLYRTPYHLPETLTMNIDSFLTNEVYSHENNVEIMQDRNIYTNERYKNIFELRHTKNKFLIEDMPKLVKNYLLITHESLLNNFINTMNNIKKFKLHVKNNIKFPLNILYDCKKGSSIFKKKNNTISKEKIIEKADLYYEKILYGNKY